VAILDSLEVAAVLVEDRLQRNAPFGREVEAVDSARSYSTNGPIVAARAWA
jgi:hypothetical protein